MVISCSSFQKVNVDKMYNVSKNAEYFFRDNIGIEMKL